MKKRIIYVVTLAEMGGAQNHVLELAKGFRADFDVEVAVGNDGYLVDQLKALNIVCHVIPQIKRSISPFSDLKAVSALRRLIRDRAPAIMHAHSSKAGLLVRLAAKLEGVRSIYSVHGWAFDVGVDFKRKLIVWPVEAFASFFSDRLVCPTEYDRKLALKTLPVKDRQISIIPYGISEEGKIAEPKENADEPIIIMPARFSEQKDQETLIKAAALLNDMSFRLQLIGDGPNRLNCEDLAKRLGVDHKVDFIGTRSDLGDLLAQAQIFCLCTNYEGLPLSIMEAMRAGLPTVATDVSGVKEEIDHDVTGFLAPHKGAEEVSVHLRKLISDSELRGQMGAAARKKFSAEFANRVMYGKLGALYNDMITGAN